MGLVERRIGVLFAGLLVLLILAAGRSVWLGGVRADALQRAAASQQVDVIDVPAERGTISDRHGAELAVSVPASDVAATPYLIPDAATAAQRLAPLLNLPDDDLLRKLAQRDTGFVYLSRNVPDTQVARIQKLKIPGLQFIPAARREYPRKWLASQILGTVGTDGGGLAGLEYGQQSVVGGRNGELRIVKDARGEPISVQEIRQEVAGKDLRLTLDAGLQDKVEQVLAQVGAQFSPKGATAIVMDPTNGDILSMANWPRVDANNFGGAPSYAAQNRAVLFNYEPGSTFKAITVAGALQDGVVTPDSMFHLPPKIQIADRVIGEAEDRPTEDLTTSQILAQSSNVGAIKIGLRLGASRFDYWVHRFGFGSLTGVALPGEESGQVLHLDQYSPSSMGNLPIGQGESVTPIQLTAAYAAIANGGMLRLPRIIAAVGGHPVPMTRGRRIISPHVAAQVRQMLEGVLKAGGTASEVTVPGYVMAGKTGTANKIDYSTGEYSKTRYIASFAGFAPAKRPKLLVTIMVDEPKIETSGAEVAAPAFQQIMSFALPYLGIAPN